MQIFLNIVLKIDFMLSTCNSIAIAFLSAYLKFYGEP